MNAKSDRPNKAADARRSGTGRSRCPSVRRRFSKAEIDGFKQRLMEKMHTLAGDVRMIRNEMAAEGPGGFTDKFGPGDLADVSHSTAAFEAGARLLEREASLLWEIEEALERIDRGTYGLCLATGKPISKARLKAMPWAKYCMEHARTLEGSSTRLEKRHRGSASMGRVWR